MVSSTPRLSGIQSYNISGDMFNRNGQKEECYIICLLIVNILKGDHIYLGTREVVFIKLSF